MLFDLLVRMTPSVQTQLNQSLQDMVTTKAFSDTMVMCSDGMVASNKLVVGTIFPFLGKTESFNVLGVDICVIVPDVSVSMFNNMVNNVFQNSSDGTHKAREIKKGEENTSKMSGDDIIVALDNKVEENNEGLTLDLEGQELEGEMCLSEMSDFIGFDEEFNEGNNDGLNKLSVPSSDVSYDATKCKSLKKKKTKNESHSNSGSNRTRKFAQDFPVIFVEKEDEIIDICEGDKIYIVKNQSTKEKVNRTFFNWGNSNTGRYGSYYYNCKGVFKCEQCEKTFKKEKNRDCTYCDTPLTHIICRASQLRWLCSGDCKRKDFNECCKMKFTKLVVMCRNSHSCYK